MDHVRKVTETLIKDRDKAIERVHDVADTAWEKGLETWNELRDQGQEAIDQAQKSAQEVWDDTRKLVQKHPGNTVGLAFMAGAVIGGALMAMRRNN
jgi:ElaB/YqjD/DUF883 family membrane-anchored ribosome-binding protein